jgi:hypothetical protein
MPESRGLIEYFGAFAGAAVGYKYVFAFAELTAMDMIAKPRVFDRDINLGGLVVMPAAGIMVRL